MTINMLNNKKVFFIIFSKLRLKPLFRELKFIIND